MPIGKISRRGFVGGSLATGAVTWVVGSRPGTTVAYDQTGPTGDLRSDSYVNSVCPLCPESCPVQIRVVDDIPRKVEGQPTDPVRNGGLCGVGFVLLQHLYHPDRAKQALVASNPVTVEKGLNELASQLAAAKNPALISADMFSREHAILARAIRTKGGSVYQAFRKYHGNELAAISELTGKPSWPNYRLRNAEVVLMWGTTLQDGHSGRAAVMRELALLRRGREDFRGKLVSINPHHDVGAIKSDIHLALRPGSDALLLWAIENALGQNKNIDLDRLAGSTGLDKEQLILLFKFLKKYSTILIVPGRGVSEQAQGKNLAQRMLQINLQYAQQSFETVPLASPDLLFDNNLVAGHDFVVNLAANPVYDYAGDDDWLKKYTAIKTKVTLGNYLDETAVSASIFLPLGHPMERKEIRVSPVAEPEHLLTVSTEKLLEGTALESDALAKSLGIAITKKQFFKSWTGGSPAESKNGFKYVPFKKIKFTAKPATLDSPPTDVLPTVDDGLVLLTYAPQSAVGGDAAHQPDLIENYGNIFLEGWHDWIEISEHDAHALHLKDKGRAKIKWAGGEFVAKIRINRLQNAGICFVPEGLGHQVESRYSNNVGHNAFVVSPLPRSPVAIELSPARKSS